MVVAGGAFAAQTSTATPAAPISKGSVPALVSLAKDLGPVAPDADMRVTVWLKPRNEAAFDQAVDQIYKPGSATYHKWMTDADLAQYAVSRADMQTVKSELEVHGLTVTGDPSGLALSAHGLVGNIESAFHTQIRNYSFKGRTFQSNAKRQRWPATPQRWWQT
jgi:subtilase family serine protease